MNKDDLESLILKNTADYFQSLSDVKQTIRERIELSDHVFESGLKNLIQRGSVEIRIRGKRYVRKTPL